MNHVKYFALILSSFVLLSACSHSPTEVDSQLDSLASNAGHSLTVDVAAVRSAEAVPPVGLWLNAVKDNLDSEPALQDLGVKALRWSPLDAYFDNSNAPKFKVGIEDPNNSLNFVVDEDGYRQHDLNFDDFMSVANSIGAKPIIDVYIHSAIYEGSLPHGDWDTIVQAAADLVEYANITQGYGVKRWEIGNEVDLNGWNVEDYARMVKDMSTAMKAVDPTIEVGVNGMTGEGWWDELLPKVGEYADYLISHQYSWYTDYTQWSTNVFTVGGNIGHVVDARDKYTPDLPIIITEISSLNPDQSEEANSVWRALHNIEVQAMGYYKGSDQNYAWGSRWFGDENVGMTRVFNADYQPLPLRHLDQVYEQCFGRQDARLHAGSGGRCALLVIL